MNSRETLQNILRPICCNVVCGVVTKPAILTFARLRMKRATMLESNHRLWR